MFGTKSYDEGLCQVDWCQLLHKNFKMKTDFGYSALGLMLFCLFCQMLLDPMGGIVMTNDGNAILREVRFH